MPTSRNSDPKFMRSYKRDMLRSAFVSLFWAVITQRKKSGNFTLQALAKSLSTNKAEVSRWFSGDPNWTVNTIANLADALEVNLQIQATDRKTGAVFTPAGIQVPSTTPASQTIRVAVVEDAPTATPERPLVSKTNSPSGSLISSPSKIFSTVVADAA